MDAIIDLRSDTVTRPGKEMLEAMFQAKVGDDVFKEDPTVNELEDFAANMFGMEAGLFCPSGTMTNQIAIKTHTQPLDEVICDKLSHIYQYETGGFAFHSGVSIRLLDGKNGIISAEQIEANIHPDFDWLPNSRLVVLENTSNKGGGGFYQMNEIKKIQAVCKKNSLQLHLDGARLFNALTETKESPLEYGKIFDSISICLSKGLGAPVGSLLLGESKFIKKARKIRKVMGGGMRQAGYLAAAGLYALKNNISKLKEDHRKCKEIYNTMQSLNYIESCIPPSTNILLFNLTSKYTESTFLAELAKHNILGIPFGKQQIRFVTHLDFTDEMLKKTIEILKKL